MLPAAIALLHRFTKNDALFHIMGIIHLHTFIVAVVIFALTPGVDTLFILNRTLSQGQRAGFYSSFGILSGVLVHVSLAAFGLSIILAKSATAFMVVKYLGAAYLLYLGFSKLAFKKQPADNAIPKNVETATKIYISGVITNVFNPKVALFFMAFFPQFIDPQYIGSAALPFLSLGMIYLIIDILWCILVVLAASCFSDRIIKNDVINQWLNHISALVYIALGMRIALSKR